MPSFVNSSLIKAIWEISRLFGGMKGIFCNLVPSKISYLDKYCLSPTKDTTIKVRVTSIIALE